MGDLENFQTTTLGYKSPQFPVSVSDLSLYIAFLFNKKLSPSTISSEISKIGYFHKISGHDDPSAVFSIKKMITGARKLKPSLDIRLPITLQILSKLTAALEFTCTSAYNRSLFKAMYLTAFHGFLRIGEITTRSPDKKISISLSQLHFLPADKGPDSVEIQIIDFKHNIKKEPFRIIIGPQQNVTCAVTALKEYINLRGNSPGPLFCLPNLTPIHRDTFNKQLSKDLSFCHLDSSKYKGHSFRIGAASLAAANNVSDARIRLLGRWKSDAFKKYIRTSSLWSTQATGAN